MLHIDPQSHWQKKQQLHTDDKLQELQTCIVTRQANITVTWASSVDMDEL